MAQTVKKEPRRPGFNPWIGKIFWRGEWLPTPLFLPGESHGQRSLAGCSTWCCRVGHGWVTNTYLPIPTLVRSLFFLNNGCWILSNDISASIEMIISVSSFDDVVYITLIWLGIINCPWDPRVNPTRSCFLILFMYCIGFSLLIFYWGFLHLYLSNISTHNFLSSFFW